MQQSWQALDGWRLLRFLGRQYVIKTLRPCMSRDTCGWDFPFFTLWLDHLARADQGSCAFHVKPTIKFASSFFRSFV